MRVLVTSPAHFVITSDGTLWINTSSLNYSFWSRYLEVYSEVHLLMRAKQCSVPPEGWERASGPGIKPVPLPDILTPLQFVRKRAEIRSIIKATLAEVDAIQLRLPCFIGTEVWRSLKGQRPYGVEVVGDPYDAFAPGCIQHPLRPFFRWQGTRNMRQQCLQADACLYVTERVLQRRYPCPHYSVGVTDVEISEQMIVPTPRRSHTRIQPLKLIMVGSLSQLYKAPDVLINAVAICVQQGLDLQLTFVGDGKYRQQLEQQSATLGVGDRVCFQGQLTSRQAVLDQLDKSDLFILPSLTEGLPRAMIEAMARGLPCLGSAVGGMPELLPPENLVPPGDANALAAKIREVALDPERMADMSERNLKKAKEFNPELLHEKRTAFYNYVREKTEEWLTLRANFSPTTNRAMSIKSSIF